MSQTSLKKQILEYLQKREEWISGREIEGFAHAVGHKGATAGRRCRELYNDGLIDRDFRKGCVQYRYTRETEEIPIIGTIKDETVNYFSKEQQKILEKNKQATLL